MIGRQACFFVTGQVFVLLVFIFSSEALCQDPPGISAATYARRRAAVLEMMPDSSVAIFHAAASKTRLNDVEYEYRQENNLFYLTGLRDPNTALILVRGGVEIDGQASQEIIFVPEKTPSWARLEGRMVTAEEAGTIAGLATVKSYAEFRETVMRVLSGKKTAFYAYPVEFLHDRLTGKRYFISDQARESLREEYPALEVKSPNRFLMKLRQIKSEEEVVLLQKAIDITCEAHLEAMRRATPGMYEYQLEAVIEYVFKHLGAESPAFPSIVGSGPNSTVLHHWKNRRQTADGDLVVVDIGAEYSGYAADVTRTIPVNGRFSPEQRKIYEIVLRAQNAALSAVKPGVPFGEIHRVARKIIEDAGYGAYFKHGTSHYLGLDTHDAGDHGPLQPGMVITVEPGIYIRQGALLDHAYWNIGVRIEDDVLVTDDGHQLLSEKAPREMAAIEQLMRQEGKWTISID
ncbi:MAG: aminopeptidase P N-terminal domain-containing protein [bacterium]